MGTTSSKIILQSNIQDVLGHMLSCHRYLIIRIVLQICSTWMYLEPQKVKGKKLYRIESLLGVGLPQFGTLCAREMFQ